MILCNSCCCACSEILSYSSVTFSHLTHFMSRSLSIPPENIRKPKFFCVFRGYRKKSVVRNGLMELSLEDGRFQKWNIFGELAHPISFLIDTPLHLNFTSKNTAVITFQKRLLESSAKIYGLWYKYLSIRFFANPFNGSWFFNYLLINEWH